MPLSTGTTLKNRYRVECLLGHGGMAEVYKVEDLQRGVPLAMKVLHEELSEDRVFLRRFQREAQNLASLQHPNIVRFYGMEQDGPLAFILMDYIEGLTLRRVIFDAGGPLPMQRVLAILQPVCSALNYAHRQGIVHCDLKSSNIMVDKNDKVYLTDFGIARMTDMATSTLIGAGTPAYMAPELIMGKDPTPQSDIYALGIVLFEMLSGGERPFTGERAGITGTTAEKVRWEHLHAQPPSLSMYNRNVIKGMDEIICLSLTKDVNSRFQSSLDLYKAVIGIQKIAKNSEKLGLNPDPYTNKSETSGAFKSFQNNEKSTLISDNKEKLNDVINEKGSKNLNGRVEENVESIENSRRNVDMKDTASHKSIKPQPNPKNEQMEDINSLEKAFGIYLAISITLIVMMIFFILAT